MLRIGLLFCCLVQFATASAAKSVSGEIHFKEGKFSLPDEQSIKKFKDGSAEFMAGLLPGIDAIDLELGTKMVDGAVHVTYKITIPDDSPTGAEAIVAALTDAEFKTKMASAVTELFPGLEARVEAGDITAVTAKLDAATTAALVGKIVSGELTLTGVDFTKLAEAAKNLLKNTAAIQIAALLEGITKDHVKIFLPSRRLSEARRLADTKLTYEITIPEGAKVTQQQAVDAVKTDKFKENFAEEATKIDGITITKDQLKVTATKGATTNTNGSTDEDATERLSVLAVLLASVGWILS